MRTVALTLLTVALLGCSDAKEVNAAFSRNQVSWAVFDSSSPTGLRSLLGFGQGVKVVWTPRDRASVVTDTLALADRSGALAVSHLGLLLVDDSTGSLASFRPGAQFPLDSYETGRLFEWSGRVFVTLTQEAPLVAGLPAQPPASLAWWSKGQTRVAFYPIPSQVRDPSRQAVRFEVLRPGVLELTWKIRQGVGWAYETTSLNLADGSEGSSSDAQPALETPDKRYAPLRLRLSQRLGSSVPAVSARGDGPALLMTDSGWVAVAAAEGARLYRLPDLGQAGRYVKALALDKGFVFVWEVAQRGYAGATGVVHVPFAVLAP